MDNIIIEKLNHITICYVKFVESVKLMIQEHYDTPEFCNTIIYVNCLPNDTVFDAKFNNLFHNKIYYQLEHKVTDEYYYSSQCCEWDNYYLDLIKKQNITEMWTMDYKPQFGVRCEQEIGIPVIYKPVRYSTLINPIENINTASKNVDLCLIGGIYDSHRQEIIGQLINNMACSFKALFGKKISSFTEEMNASRFIIDILREKSILTQNQVRIFELLCMGYTVCAEKCSINMFPGLIYEWENIDDLYNIVKRGEYLHPTEAYKEMTYTDEAYEKYVNNLIKQWNTLG
jgi:hypothetical protein